MSIAAVDSTTLWTLRVAAAEWLQGNRDSPNAPAVELALRNSDFDKRCDESKGTKKRSSKEIEELLTGGNHLASVLINRMGAANKFLDYHASIDEARKKFSGEDLDLWICWRGIMLFRDSKYARCYI